MHIAFSADEKYAQHMGVALASLLVNLRHDSVPDIYIIDGGISAASKEKIAALTSIRTFNVHYLTVDPAVFGDFPLTADYNSVTIYYRLALPYLLPHLDKILYLDTDIVVDDNLAPLWETDLGEAWLGAVFEPDVNTAFTTTIGLEASDPYFNSGVLLMNLQELRQVDFLDKCLACALQYQHALRYPDQDTLNVVCLGHVMALSPRYNMVAAFSNKSHAPERLVSVYETDTIRNAVRRPAIIHFLGRRKPWLYICYSPFAGRYWEYLKRTPWKDYRYPDKNLRTITSKILYNLRNKHK